MSIALPIVETGHSEETSSIRIVSPTICFPHVFQLLAMVMFVALAAIVGCGSIEQIPLPNETNDTEITDDLELVTRFVHITDAQLIDEESPARLVPFADIAASAWRPHEAYSTQLFDGTIKAINALHMAGLKIDFVLHTGDAADNAQLNEFKWFLDILDGNTINPLTGLDDRSDDQHGDPLLDPHQRFDASGLYRHGTHGTLPSIPWYTLPGNHDRYAAGIFPITTRTDGTRFAPLSISNRIGLFLPTMLVPEGNIAYSPVSPANPEPENVISLMTTVLPNPARRYASMEEFVSDCFDTITEVAGHGFEKSLRSYYSVSPASGVRLVSLDTSLASTMIPTGFYYYGGITAEQRDFLKIELAQAQAAGEIVIIASHHPSSELSPLLGTSMMANDLRGLLNDYPNVVAHLVGHLHRNRVWDRGGYVEIETSAILDYPQEGRVIEIWRSTIDNSVVVTYSMFSHLYTGRPFDMLDQQTVSADSMLPMRQIANQLAQEHAKAFHLFKHILSHPSVADSLSPGSDDDREGAVRLSIPQ